MLAVTDRACARYRPLRQERKERLELVSRRLAKAAGHAARGEDYTLSHLLAEAKVSEDVAKTLLAAGVDDLEELIIVTSRGDHHDELKKCGIGKLGARARLATLVQPYWRALSMKEQVRIH